MSRPTSPAARIARPPRPRSAASGPRSSSSTWATPRTSRRSSRATSSIATSCSGRPTRSIGDGLRAEIRLGAADPRIVEDPYALTGDPARVVAHVATHLAAFGETVRAGDVIIAGSIVPALAVAPGDRLRYRLEPAGEIALDFAG